MFRQHPRGISDVLSAFLRSNGLETPLLQHRLVDSWEEVAGSMVARYTEEKKISNQTLWVKISSPALRSDLQMRRSDLVRELNDRVGAQIITDIKIY